MSNTDNAPEDRNTRIIREFRENEGRVGGGFTGIGMVIIHTKGAKTGEERVIPLVYQKVGDAYAIFGSTGGGPKHPAWFHNLVAHPDITAEIGTETLNVRARVAQGEERTRIWEQQKSDHPGFA